MSPGDSVYDASRPAPGEGDGPGVTASQGSGDATRSPRAYKPVQDIQEIIDKLADVTQQLRQLAGHRS